MATWKMVSGIISIVLSVVVFFQSCAANTSGAFMEFAGKGSSFAGTAGKVVALLMLAGGITSIVTRNKKDNNSIKALIALFGLATVICIVFVGSVFKELLLWGVWCAVNAGMAFKDLRENDSQAAMELADNIKAAPKTALKKVKENETAQELTKGIKNASQAVLNKATEGKLAKDVTDTIMSASQTALDKVASASNKVSEEIQKKRTTSKDGLTCPACGAAVDKGEETCPECGADLKPAVGSSSGKEEADQAAVEKK